MIRAPLAALVLLLVIAATALADRVVLKNGAVFHGEVISENSSEIEFKLEDGMTIRIRRSKIDRLERTGDSEEPWDQGLGPPPRGGGGNGDVVVPLPAKAPASEPGLFESNVETAWFRRYGRYPTLTAAKTTGFRAYEYLSHAPLDLSRADPELLRDRLG